MERIEKIVLSLVSSCFIVREQFQMRSPCFQVLWLHENESGSLPHEKFMRVKASSALLCW